MSFFAIFFLLTSLFVSVSAGIIFHLLSLIIFFWDKESFWKDLKVTKSMICFLMLIIWASISSVYWSLEKETWDILIKNKYLYMGVISLPLFYTFIKKTSTNHKEKLLKWLWLTLFISLIGSLVKLFIFPEMPLFKLHAHRIGGLTGTMKFGYTAALLASICFSIIINKYKTVISTPKFLISFFALCIFSLIFSQTRGATLGLVISIMVMSCLKYQKMKKYILGAGLAGLIGYLVLSPHFENSKIRFLMPLKAKSNMIRLSFWETATHVIKDYPVLGVGSFQFRNYVKDYKIKYDLPLKQYYYMHTHNSFIEPFVSWGIPGGILFFLWFIFWFFEALKVNELKVKFTPFLITFFIAGQFEVMQSGTLYFLFMGIYSLFIAYRKTLWEKKLNV